MAPKKVKPLRFEQLIAKVQQAEDMLEAQERSVSADLRQLRDTWRKAWTPGRIVIAGLASGFLIGRAEPGRAIGKSGQLMHLVSMVSSLFAGGSAKVAAEEAGEAKQEVREAAPAAAAAAAAAAVGDAPPAVRAPDEEAIALARAEAALRAARTATVDQVQP
jgi:hypothetical protein